jgi:hypothetical protein
MYTVYTQFASIVENGKVCSGRMQRRVDRSRALWYTGFSLFFLKLIVPYTPSLSAIFSVSALQLLDWAFAMVFAAIMFGSFEIVKWITSRKWR